ncbi:MAG: hypothetical protein D6712_13530, partial [Chloroflexi bacterium]
METLEIGLALTSAIVFFFIAVLRAVQKLIQQTVEVKIARSQAALQELQYQLREKEELTKYDAAIREHYIERMKNLEAQTQVYTEQIEKFTQVAAKIETVQKENITLRLQLQQKDKTLKETAERMSNRITTLQENLHKLRDILVRNQT